MNDFAILERRVYDTIKTYMPHSSITTFESCEKPYKVLIRNGIIGRVFTQVDLNTAKYPDILVDYWYKKGVQKLNIADKLVNAFSLGLYKSDLRIFTPEVAQSLRFPENCYDSDGMLSMDTLIWMRMYYNTSTGPVTAHVEPTGRYTRALYVDAASYYRSFKL